LVEARHPYWPKSALDQPRCGLSKSVSGWVSRRVSKRQRRPPRRTHRRRRRTRPRRQGHRPQQLRLRERHPRRRNPRRTPPRPTRHHQTTRRCGARKCCHGSDQRTCPCPRRVGPTPGDQVAVPAQYCLGCHREDRPPRAGQQPGQRRQQQPVPALVPWPGHLPGHLPAQHRQLVPQHQELHLVPCVGSAEQHSANADRSTTGTAIRPRRPWPATGPRSSPWRNDVLVARPSHVGAYRAPLLVDRRPPVTAEPDAVDQPAERGCGLVPPISSPRNRGHSNAPRLSDRRRHPTGAERHAGPVDGVDGPVDEPGWRVAAPAPRGRSFLSCST
jgi:hypothetical protein